MQIFLLIGGVLYAAALGWWLIGRLGRFLDRGGISPYWDESEEQAVQKETTAEADALTRRGCCSQSDSKI